MLKKDTQKVNHKGIEGDLLKKWIIGGVLSSAVTFGLFFLIFVALLSAIVGDEEQGKSNCGTTDFGVVTEPAGDQVANAQLIFNYLVKTEKFSGKGASGAVAVAERESSFNPLAVNPSGGVAGWFQWSGFSNTVNGSRITAEGSIVPGDLSTLTPENQFKLLSFELNGSYKNVKELVGKATDSGQAALDWSQYYEGIVLTDTQQTKAEQIKASAAKWELTLNAGNIPSEIKDTASDGVTTAQVASDPCEAGDAVPIGQGSGSQIKIDTPFGYGTLYEDLPAEVKKGIGKRSSFKQYPEDNPWGHQCVWYARHRANEFGNTYGQWGSGWEYGVGREAEGYTTVVGTPYPHVVANAKPSEALGSLGHTFFVEWVNPDGSLIISECNVMPGHVGLTKETATQPIETYRYVSPAEAKEYRYIVPNNLLKN